MLEPATSVIKLLGGPAKVAEIAKVHRTRVSNWMRPRAKGGTGGRIPQEHHPALLDYAAGHELDLRAEHFLPARQPAPETGAVA